MGDLDLTQGQGQPSLAQVILPELVWEKALKFLKDPEDVLNAGKTCTLFQRLIHSEMVAANFSKIFPFLMNYLDDKNILNCRSVSKGWRDVIDNFFEKYFLERALPDDGTEGEGLVSFPVTYSSCALYVFNNQTRSKSSNHELFIREMKDHPRNPFIGRAIHFSHECAFDWELDDYVDDHNNFQSLYDFFKTFGKHIWTFKLGIYDPHGVYQTGSAVFQFVMKDLFVLAPNLKRFIVEELFTTHPITIDLTEINLAPPPSLQRLEISGLSQFPNVERAILQRHSNTLLKTLRVQYPDHLHNMTWPHLKELHPASSDTQWILSFLQTMRAPQLELLSLKLSNFYFISEKEVFLKVIQSISHFSNLKTVRLYWENKFDGFLEPPEDLQCPENIKTLEIYEGPDAPVNYSFLRYFPFVEKVHVQSMAEFPMQELEEIIASESVQVHRFIYDGRMYESNIWKLFPSLKVFSFGKRIYSRSSYERRCLRSQPARPNE